MLDGNSDQKQGLGDTIVEQSHGRLAIAISIYRPDEDLLDRLIDTLASSRATILAHVDGPIHDAITSETLARLRRDERISVSQSARNEGVATTLNALVKKARERGCEWVLFFDQDTEPAPELPDRLLAALLTLEQGGHRPAVIGPHPMAADPANSKAPTYRWRPRSQPVGSCYPADFVITSGSLVRLSTFSEIGLFREDFRNDGVDLEWCFRAWAKGMSVWSDLDSRMLHRVGIGVVRLASLRFPRQPIERMQGYTRNQARMLRIDHVPLRWKIWIIFYLPIQIFMYTVRSKDKYKTVTSITKSIADGLRWQNR